jgi:hypothetical protein
LRENILTDSFCLSCLSVYVIKQFRFQSYHEKQTLKDTIHTTKCNINSVYVLRSESATHYGCLPFLYFYIFIFYIFNLRKFFYGNVQEACGQKSAKTVSHGRKRCKSARLHAGGIILLPKNRKSGATGAMWAHFCKNHNIHCLGFK